jgi:hypothetical protein
MAGNYDFHGLNTDVLSILAFDDNAWRYAPRRLLGGQAPPRLYYKRMWHRETGSAANMAKELSFESEFFAYLNLAHPAGSVRSHILQVLALSRRRLVFFLVEFRCLRSSSDIAMTYWMDSGAVRSIKQIPLKGVAADGFLEVYRSSTCHTRKRGTRGLFVTAPRHGAFTAPIGAWCPMASKRS